MARSGFRRAEPLVDTLRSRYTMDDAVGPLVWPSWFNQSDGEPCGLEVGASLPARWGHAFGWSVMDATAARLALARRRERMAIG